MQRIKFFFFIFVVGFWWSSCAQQKAQKEHLENKQTMINKSEEEWRKTLSPEQYYVLREKGTERPFTGELLLNKEKGIYKCAGCGNELFTDDMKFDAHCGWPSFDKEIAGGKILKNEDRSHGMIRTEIVCAKCGGHLGHLFDDGPTATGQRYCVNSLSLSFEAVAKKEEPTTNNFDTAMLGGGCFWCVDAIYRKLEGVEKVTSGFAGGSIKNPAYREVCNGNTGHAEVVEIVYDKSKISFEDILKVFFAIHDPTTLNKQGADEGTQYRSVVFYKNETEKNTVQSIINAIDKEAIFPSKIVTTLEPYCTFYSAEAYHQDYFSNNKSQPYCQIVIQPKVDKFEKLFNDRLKK